MTIADKIFTSGWDIIPEDASGQALGDATHVWDLFAGDVDIAGHAAVGAAASVDTHYVVNVQETFTTTAFNFFNSAVFAVLNAAPAGNTAVTRFHGVYARVDYTGGNDITVSNSLRGFYGGIDLQGTGNITDVCGVQGLVQATAAGNATVGDIFNFEAVYFNEAIITATNWYGFYMHTLAGGGGTLNLTNAYGLYIEAITQAATNYAIYCAGGASYHAGNFGIAMIPTANGLLSIGTPTENFEVIDAGSAGATEQDWVEVEVGGVQGFLRVFAAV